MSEIAQKIQELKNNFLHFSSNFLKIRTKEGSIIPFNLNQAQQHVHKLIEKQKREAGKVRAIILKGRQQGCSTYVTGRFYWKVAFRKGVKCFIVTHRDDATSNLYKIVKRYHDNNRLKPSTGVSNAKELYFDKLDSGYGIGTAGSGNVGRSDTIQYLHMSEVAFMQNTSELQTGLMQTVPESEGTEIIIESTANGMGNMFHKYCLDAISGENGYQLIFVPWYWQDEYRTAVDKDFALTEDEKEYKKMYKLDDSQMHWRRKKIASFTDGDRKFKQEYPATIYEAFQTSSTRTIISNELVQKSLNFVSSNYMRFCAIIGVDVAREGADKSIIAIRQGNRIMGIKKFHGLDGHQLAREVIAVANQFKTKYIFVDATGVGASPLDFLKYYGYPARPVFSGQSADDKLLYANKRAEMWFRLKSAMEEGLQFDYDEEMILQMQSQLYDYRLNNQIILPSKEKMRSEGLKSPDIVDAICLTYAYIFNTLDIKQNTIKVINNNNNDVLK